MPPKRPHYTADEIASQLQQLTTYTDVLPSSSTLGGSSSLSLGSEGIVGIAPIIRNSIASRQQDAYLRQLSAVVKSKETEIEDVCRANYQDFVGATDKLLRVRQGTVSLKHRVQELNEDIQSKGGDVADKKRAMLESRRVGQNIDDTIDTLQACLRVLDLSDKVGRLIEKRKHYAALRALDDLESNQLKPVLHFPFAAHMLARLASTRQQIRDAVTKEMKAWLFEAREASRTVGKLALEGLEQRNRRWKARKARDVDGTLRLARINGPVELAVSERHEVNVLDNDHVRIDFRPLHQCIHIHDALGAREELQASYQEDRRAQASLLLSQTTGLRTADKSISIPALETLLEQIVGFFVIEARVRQITDGFRPEAVVDDLWDDVVERTVAIVIGAIEPCQDVEASLAAKHKLLTFVQALDTWGYTTTALHGLLQHLSEVFLKLLEHKFGSEFEQIIAEDDYQPMVVNTLDEFDNVVDVSWLPADSAWSEAELRKLPFPLALPFSLAYPLCCNAIRNFVDQYYQYADGLQQHHRDVDDIVRASLDRTLVKRVSDAVAQRVAQTTNLSQLAQVVVNLLFFETACSELESLLVQLRASHRGGTVRLESVAAFRTTLEHAHSRIVLTVGKKLDDCFELADYRWDSKPGPSLSQSSSMTARTAMSGDDRPSEYLSEMADYLTNLVHSVLYQLPPNVRVAVYRGALEHIADTMTAYLSEPVPDMMSDAGLAQFAVDVKFITRHAAESLPDGGTDDVFEELSQTVALLQSENLADYLDPDIRDLAYPRIQSRNLALVLIKLIKYLNANTSILGTPPDPRRKAQMEDVLKAISGV